MIFKEIEERGHEQVVFCQDPKSGLRAIVAIHSTVLGPSVGGCRVYPYANEADALMDVLRLSRGMTFKSAVAGLRLGGGKSVILANPHTDKSPELWRSFGGFLEGLSGRYVCAEDSGTSPSDMDILRSHTKHVVGMSPSLGGYGDPSEATAIGVFAAIRALAEYKLARQSLASLRVAVQGCGHVGYLLIGHLSKAGAKVWASDVREDALQRACADFGATPVKPEEIHQLPCDVFAPCALGAILHPQSITQLQCEIIAGAANNQLADESRDAGLLAKRGILYAPDFVVNAGGIINCANELYGEPRENTLRQAEEIFDTTLRIVKRAEDEEILPLEAAYQVAQERLKS